MAGNEGLPEPDPALLGDGAPHVSTEAPPKRESLRRDPDPEPDDDEEIDFAEEVARASKEAGPDGDEPDMPDFDVLQMQSQGARPRQRAAPSFGSQVSEITSRIAALGAQVKVCVVRTAPEDLPSAGAISSWINVPSPTPDFEAIVALVRRRYGGGEYVVTVKSTDLNEPHEENVPLKLDGDPAPSGLEDQLWLAQRKAQADFGLPFHVPNGEQMDTTTNPLLQLMGARDQRDQERADREREAQASQQNTMMTAFAAIAQAMRPAPQPSVLEGIVPLLGVVAPLITESMRARAEDRRRADERHERWMAEMLSKAGGGGADFHMEAMRGALEMQRVAAQGAMQTQADNNKVLMETMIARLKEEGRDGEATVMGAFADAMRQGIPTLVENFPSIVEAWREAKARDAEVRAAQAQAQTQQATATVDAPPAMPAGEEPPPPPPDAEAPRENPQEQAPDMPFADRVDWHSVPQAPPARAMAFWIANLMVMLQGQPDAAAAWGAELGEGYTLQSALDLTPAPFRDDLAQLDPDDPDPTGLCDFSGIAALQTACRILSELIDPEQEGGEARMEWLGDFLDHGPWHVEGEEEDEPEPDSDTEAEGEAAVPRADDTTSE